jgi:hypothetical protein
MLSPEGWTMPVCVSEPRPGRNIHYEWQNSAKGTIGGFYLTGEYLQFKPPPHRSTSTACSCLIPHLTTTSKPVSTPMAAHPADNAHDAPRRRNPRPNARHPHGARRHGDHATRLESLLPTENCVTPAASRVSPPDSGSVAAAPVIGFTPRAFTRRRCLPTPCTNFEAI